MRQIFGALLIVGVVVGFAFRAQAQSGSDLLVLDVYSVKVPSDIVHEKAFALWAKSLKAGDGGSYEHSPVIHEIYRLDRVVGINKPPASHADAVIQWEPMSRPRCPLRYAQIHDEDDHAHL
jgi:hypothetical protein